MKQVSKDPTGSRGEEMEDPQERDSLTQRAVSHTGEHKKHNPVPHHPPHSYGSLGASALGRVPQFGEEPFVTLDTPGTPRLDEYELNHHQGNLDPQRLQHLRHFGFPKLPKSEAVVEYEEHQEELLKELRSYDEGHFANEEAEDPFMISVAIWGSFGINVILTCLKLAILIMSGSVSVLASFLDSCLDLLSGSIIFVASLFQNVKPSEVHEYPVGKTRLETLAVLVFSTTMFTATGQLLTTGVTSLLQQEFIDLDIGWITIGVLLGTIAIKLVLWQVCRLFSHGSVQALAQDHRNDVLSNGIATLTAVGGFYWRPWLDPFGGVIISLLIMYTWFETGLEQLEKLMGKTADPDFLSKLTYIAYIHDKRVLFVDTVRAYSVTDSGFIVEVDVVLPREMTLEETHDIGEALQHKLEMVPGVERAFVHIDFEFEHRAKDEHKQFLG